MHGQIDEDNDKDGEDNDDLKGRRKDSSVAIMEALMRTALGLVRKKICVVSNPHSKKFSFGKLENQQQTFQLA